jgi:site-specific DNA-cytosine methylase
MREMRCATNNEYPKLCVFENVVGLLSNNSRRDYKTVLEAFTESELPMPKSGRWANAGMVRSDGIDLAWVVKNARHFRVPQQRRRLFLVVDFAGRRAGEILFKPEGSRGDHETRPGPRQNAPATVAGGAGVAVLNGRRSVTGTLEYAEERAPCLNASMPSNVVHAAFMAGQHENSYSIAYNESVLPTLKGSSSGLNQIPSVVIEPQLARTLTARADSSPCVDRGQNIVVISAPETNCLTPWDVQTSRVYTPDGIAPTLSGADNSGGRRPGGLVLMEVHPKTLGTLCASGAGTERPAGMASETNLCVTLAFGESSFGTYACTQGKIATLRRSGGTLTGGRESLIVSKKNTHDRIKYIIRRLTPTECERAMAFPDDWTRYGHDGKEMSDSARYRMCGNSVVVNVLEYIFQNIAEIF